MQVNGSELALALRDLERDCADAYVAAIRARYCYSRRGLARRLDVPALIAALGPSKAALLAAKVHELDWRRRGISIAQLMAIPDFVGLYWELSRKRFLLPDT